jgi:N-acetylneuraminic acid mutarotase
MRNLILYLLLIMFPFINSCDKEAVVGAKDYPYIITKEISDITESSVVFNGEILSTISANEIIEYGFIWDTYDPKGKKANKVVINDHATIGTYSIKIDSKLYKDSEQLVRAYIRTNNLIVYGNPISFTCNGGVPAELYEINPLKGYVGSKVVIKGNNFSYQKDKVSVFFGDIEAVIDSCSDNRIVVKVPNIDTDVVEYIAISIYNKKVKSDDKFRAFTYWKKISNLPGDARYGAAGFSINDVGYVCFGQQNYGVYNDLYTLNSGTNSWSKKEDFPGNPRAFAVSCVIDGKAYLGFGLGGDTYYHDLWSYEPESDKWTKILEDSRISTLSDACFVLNNELYIFAQSGSYKYSPTNNKLTEITRFPGDYRDFTTGVNCNGLGYIIAGQKLSSNQLLKDLWCYNPTSDTWTKKADIPQGYRDGIACFVINNKIYAGLGGRWGGTYLDFYEYTPSSNTWIRIQDFPGDRRELPVSFTINNKGYLGAGRNYRTEELNDFWEFNPSKE